MKRAQLPTVPVVHPFIPASTTLPEITPRALVLGIVLAIILAASSTFVGLKIARTISGSIPAALISMMVLRRFKNANILENNMVQTIASAGEVVAAGVIFTLPALLIIGYWQSFDYLQTAMIAVIGGILGVMFSVPLRRSMIIQDNLPFPEGVATGEILKAGEDKKSTRVLLVASALAAFISLLQTGFKLAGEQLAYWTKMGVTAVGGSLVLSPILTAAGYIVGMKGLIPMAVGGVLTWGIAIPIYVAKFGLPEAPDVGSALATVQKLQFRYMGIGVLAVGGLWSIISLTKQISHAFRVSFAAMKAHKSEFLKTQRTDRDIPFKYVLLGVLGVSVPTFILFLTIVGNANLLANNFAFWLVILFATLFSLIVGFVASAIAAYIVGIVGSTSLPISGITMTAIIAFASLLLFILGTHIDFTVNNDAALRATAIVIIFAAVISVTAAVAGDNLQDLKAGQIVGATPWKQQAMLIVGAVASALVIPFILQTTFQAYGIADVLPRVNMDPNRTLPAPQATLMATLAKGFFSGMLPWHMIQLGAGLAVIAIILDEYLKYIKSAWRFPALLFALGIYLPLGYVTAFFMGGIIHYLVDRKHNFKAEKEHNRGILCASGIIAGEAILGAILTIPFAYAKSTDVLHNWVVKTFNLSWMTSSGDLYSTLIGVILYLGLCIFLYKEGAK